MIPTCWLLGGFITPELFGDSAVWDVKVCVALLDQMIIRGNPSFSLFFLLALLPAFLEELLFRGALLNVLRPYGDGFAILTTAAFFAVIHCNFEQAPAAFLTGLLFGYAAVISGSVWPTVLAHFLNNALALAAGLLCDALPVDTANLVSLCINAAYLLAGLIGCVILFRKSRPQLRLRGGAGRFPAGKLLGTTLSRPGVLLFLAVCLILTALSFHAG